MEVDITMAICINNHKGRNSNKNKYLNKTYNNHHNKQMDIIMEICMLNNNNHRIIMHLGIIMGICMRMRANQQNNGHNQWRIIQEIIINQFKYCVQFELLSCFNYYL